jgi:hypothetical protein
VLLEVGRVFGAGTNFWTLKRFCGRRHSAGTAPFRRLRAPYAAPTPSPCYGRGS